WRADGRHGRTPLPDRDDRRRRERRDGRVGARGDGLDRSVGGDALPPGAPGRGRPASGVVEPPDRDRPVADAMLPALLLAATTLFATGETVYEKDMEFALDELEKQCKPLLDSKKIDWDRVRKELTALPKKEK